jgi:hypothetical protein
LVAIARLSDMARALIAAVAPVAITIAFAARGWLNIEHLVMLGGLVVFTFAPAYLFADFILSLLARTPEEDAPGAAR